MSGLQKKLDAYEHTKMTFDEEKVSSKKLIEQLK